MIFGDATFLGGVDVGGAPDFFTPPTAHPAGIGTSLSDRLATGPVVYTGPADQWGLISVPTGPAPDGESQGDPALWLYLRFLRTFLQTDKHATALWAASGMAPGVVVVNAIRAHNPTDDESSTPGLGITTKDLPALYMWRHDGIDSSSAEYIAEDWLLETSDVRLLWVFPESVQAMQRMRTSFVNALAKCIVSGIERGRTPSFIIPGDADPMASLFGSDVHLFSGAFAFNAMSWGPSRVRITTVGERDDASSSVIRHALAMRFQLQENLVQDPNMWSVPSALQQTVSNGQPAAPPWGPVTAYSASAVILVTPPGSLVSYLFQSTGAGTSGATQPIWPITTGANIGDGSITWTCLGRGPSPFSVMGRA